MSTLLELARDLVSAINDEFDGSESEETSRGLPAEFRYLPTLDRARLPVEASLRVTLGAISISETAAGDTCDQNIDRAVSVVFSKRLATAGSVEDVADSEELDELIDWIETLFVTLAGLELDDWGKPERIEFVSPGPVDLFAMEWLVEHRIFVSVIALGFGDPAL